MAETGRLEKRTNRSRESSLKLTNTTQSSKKHVGNQNNRNLWPSHSPESLRTTSNSKKMWNNKWLWRQRTTLRTPQTWHTQKIEIFLASILTQHHWPPRIVCWLAKARQQLFPNWTAKTKSMTSFSNERFGKYLFGSRVIQLVWCNYLPNVGKFGSTGIKYPVMLISVNRGVKYHVAISSAILVRHTSHFTE